MAAENGRTASLLKAHAAEVTQSWIGELKSTGLASDARISEAELNTQATEFMRLLSDAVQDGVEIDRPAWASTRAFLENISRTRAAQGFASDQTATFIFSLKRPLFALVSGALRNDPQALQREVWAITELVDKLGLHTIKHFQKAREDVIVRQQEELLELSTPVVKLWDGVLALPMIGTLDSSRTQVVMESLLQRIVETGAEIAIIDITGVPTVDTLVAQHLLKTVTAIRLMGADCIISGVRPQIAQTIVHLGVDLQGVTTKASLADALSLALKRNGFLVTRKA